MPPARTRVVVTRRLPAPVEARMQELFDVRLNADDLAMTAEELARAMAEADVLVPTITDRIDARLLAQAGPQYERRPCGGQGRRRGTPRISAIAMSAVSSARTPGVLETMIPRCSAVATSMWSKPAP